MFRSYQLRLKPNQVQRTAFEEILRDSAETYNAGLQERIEAWKLQRKNISMYEQAIFSPALPCAIFVKWD